MMKPATGFLIGNRSFPMKRFSAIVIEMSDVDNWEDIAYFISFPVLEEIETRED